MRLVPGAVRPAGALLVALTALALSSVVAVAAPARPSPAALKGNLQHILDKPEYRQVHNPWLAEWVERLLRRVSEWYRQYLASRFERLHDASPIAYWTVVAVGTVLVLVLLYHIYLTLRSALGGTGARGRRRGAPLPPEVQAAPEALLSEADAAAAAGDFPLALRQLYLALIRNLDRHSLLRYDRSHTNYEYLRQVREEQAVAEPLAALTRQAEAVWYGHRRLDRTGYDECRALALAAWQGEAGSAAS